jgi:hypothetical protein
VFISGIVMLPTKEIVIDFRLKECSPIKFTLCLTSGRKRFLLLITNLNTIRPERISVYSYKEEIELKCGADTEATSGFGITRENGGNTWEPSSYIPGNSRPNGAPVPALQSSSIQYKRKQITPG